MALLLQVLHQAIAYACSERQLMKQLDQKSPVPRTSREKVSSPALSPVSCGGSRLTEVEYLRLLGLSPSAAQLAAHAAGAAPREREQVALMTRRLWHSRDSTFRAQKKVLCQPPVKCQPVDLAF